MKRDLSVGMGVVMAGWCLMTVTPLMAEIRTEKVQYQHEGTELEGVLVYDDAIEGRRPGVLVVHEWWGLNDYARHRAGMLAKMGYAAFAVDMYGVGKNTQDPKQAGHWAGEFKGNDKMRTRARLGLDILRRSEHVDPERIAAIGYCFGGTTVTQLAYSGADIKGVVSFHGSLPIPEPEDMDEGRIKAHILICHGSADSFISDEHLLSFKNAINQTDATWEMVIYGGAKHSFTNRAADARGIPGLRYDPKADHRSWMHMKRFFKRIFRARLGD